jgi:hypothetical protein
MLNPDQAKEFDALLPGQSTLNGANRRTALKVALGVGYAAATCLSWRKQPSKPRLMRWLLASRYTT